MINERKIWIIIPAKDEAKTIKDVIKRCRKSVPTARILVVNDGSTDHTVSYATHAGATMISHPINFGKGSSIRSGWLWLTWTQGLHYNDLIIHLDADGQHMPEDIPKMLECLDLNNVDMVIGKRNLSKYPLYKKFGNKCLSIAASLFSGKKIEDGESGFRVFKYGMMYDLLKVVNAQQYEIEMEINIVLGQMGYDVKFVDIQSPRYRKGVGVSGGIKNMWAGLKTWLKIKLGWLKW